MHSQYYMLSKPIITKKTSIQKRKHKLTLEVSKFFNKIQIINFVNKIFNVRVLSVNIMNCRGKVKRIGRNKGKSKNRKKAILTLSKMSNINVFGKYIYQAK